MSILFACIIGLAAGLLVDYLSDHLPIHQKWGQPICVHCSAARAWPDYFLFRPCRACGEARPWRSGLILALAILFSVWLWFHPVANLGYWGSLALVAYFGLVAVIDIEHRLIQHVVSLFGAGLGLVLGFIAHGIGQTLAGGLAGVILMFILYELGVVFARFNARRHGLENPVEEALGFGDVTLSGVLGLILGFGKIFQGLLTGILLAGAFSLVLIAVLLSTKKFRLGDIYIPYGPFLILGACVYIFYR